MIPTPSAVIRARALLGISQSELARRLGVSQNLVARVELGQSPMAPEIAERFAIIAARPKPRDLCAECLCFVASGVPCACPGLS